MFGTSPFSSAPFADEGPKRYDITASAITNGAPVVNTTSMSEEETLSTTGELRSDNPVIDMPTFNQGQTLAFAELVTNEPTVSDATMQEDETFSAGDLTLGVTELGTPDIVEVHALASPPDLEAGNAEVGDSAFNQDQTFEPNDLSTGNIVVSDTTMQEEETLSAATFDTGSPTVADADITENNILSAGDTNTGSVVVPDTTMFEEETFTTSVMSTGSVSLVTTSINQDQTFEPDNLETGPVSVSDVSMSEEETLSAREPVINDPETPSVDFNQGQTLASVTFVMPSVEVPSATMQEDETFDTVDLTTGSVSMIISVLRQEHLLGEANNINTGMRQVDAAFFTQEHLLSNDELVTQPPVYGPVEIEADHKFEPDDMVLVGHNVEEVYFNPALAREVNADNKKIGNRATFAGGNKTKFGRTAGNRVKVG